MSRSARLHPDGKTRCPWPGEDPFYVAYHDDEWGVPEYDDRALYEKTLAEVLATPADVYPAQRLANEIARRRAERYAKQSNDLF